jgi:hypothetical protein
MRSILRDRRAMTTASALAAARTLGRDGYWVFPCQADKRPCTPRGFHDASDDPEIIAELWAEYPGELVGVATGVPSSTAVLDIDRKHDAAVEWWQCHRERLLPTRVHRTRSGGLHLVYRHRRGLKCSAGKIARGVDVRAEGGYIIWWPAAGLPVLADAMIAPWPDWLIEKPAPLPAPPVPQRRLSTDPKPQLIGLVRTVAGAGEGERNRVLFWAACRARDMINTGQLDQADGLQALEAMHLAALARGLAHQEITRTIRSAMRAA